MPPCPSWLGSGLHGIIRPTRVVHPYRLGLDRDEDLDADARPIWFDSRRHYFHQEPWHRRGSMLRGALMHVRWLAGGMHPTSRAAS